MMLGTPQHPRGRPTSKDGMPGSGQYGYRTGETMSRRPRLNHLSVFEKVARAGSISQIVKKDSMNIVRA
jgi:hypothetical protein